jgi:hypothetical protein
MRMRKNDDAARRREDSFLAGLIPQAAEHLAEQQAGDFDAETGQARFLTWLAAHTEEPADAQERGRNESDLAGPAWGRSAKFTQMTPTQIVGELLRNHPEAASLLAEASHHRTLAVWSAATARRKFAAAQAARLAYEELRHRLDPKLRRRINFAAGLAVLVVLAASITVGLWPTALHGFGLTLGWPAVWGYARENAVSASLISTFILVLAAGAAALISRMEPASLLVARRRWYRARAAYQKAVETEQADTQAAAIAREAWLGLVRARVTTITPDDDHLVQATVARAAALVDPERPDL